jgi:hypothetical protein
VPRASWWDRAGEPPQRLIDVVQRIRDYFRTAEGPESRRAQVLNISLIAAVFLAALWLVFVSIAQHL